MTDVKPLTAEERIENAAQAASETARSWKHRCHNILSALGLDYGDPDEVMPDEVRALDAARARIAELEAGLRAINTRGPLVCPTCDATGAAIRALLKQTTEGGQDGEG